PVFKVQPLEAYLSSTLADRTFTLALIGLFGVLALALAAVGIYGVISYNVSLRAREVGIRMALGARASNVLATVLGQALAFSCAGLLVGLVVSLAVTRFIGSLLFEVRTTDVATSLESAAALLLVALAAAYIPARRASKLDPIQTLRLD